MMNDLGSVFGDLLHLWTKLGGRRQLLRARLHLRRLFLRDRRRRHRLRGLQGSPAGFESRAVINGLHSFRPRQD